MRMIHRPLCAAALLLAAAPHAAAAQKTAAEVLRAASARAQAQTRGIENYTVVVKTFGESVTFHVARVAPGGPMAIRFGGGGEFATGAGTMLGAADMLVLLLAQNAAEVEPLLTYEGVVASPGGAAHLLRMRLPGAPASREGMLPREVAVQYDTATLLPARLEMSADAPGGGDVKLAVDYSDWRPVQGMMVPFHRHLVARGFRALAFPDTAELTGIIRDAPGEMKRMPEAERTQLQQMVTMLRNLLERDEMVVDGIVTSAVANAGEPRGVTLNPLGS